MEYRQIIQNSTDYIEANLKAEITAKELADLAGFSLYHFYRIFQSFTGMPVMQYIIRRRLLHAIYEISRGCSKTDAALCYGFDTYAGFYKAFQREFSCTLSQYISSARVRQPVRLDLSKEEHMIITHKKAAEILKNWGLENEEITDIYYDNSNRNENAFYVGSKYVLKLTSDLRKLTGHRELSSAVADIGLNAAAPVKTADGRDYVTDGELYFYLTARLSGSQVLAADFYGEQGDSMSRFVGEIIGQLHLALSKAEAEVTQADLIGSVTGWALPKVRDILPGEDGFWESYLCRLEELHDRLPRHIIHRDPNPGNIIMSEDEWGFIDFELSEKNVRIYDPCYSATAILSESFEAGSEAKLRRWLDIYRNIIAGYNSVAVLTDDEWAAVPYILLANQLVCVAWFCDQEKYAGIYETNRQMTAWLISVFDELRFDC